MLRKCAIASAALSRRGGGPAFCFDFFVLFFLGFVGDVSGAFMLRVGSLASGRVIVDVGIAQL